MLFRSMLIYNHTSANGNCEVTIADSGTMHTIPNSNLMELTLYSGQSYTDEGMIDPKVRKTFPFRRLAFEKQILLIELPGTDLKRTDESLWSSIKNVKKRVITYFTLYCQEKV